jgi:hypothetical protein
MSTTLSDFGIELTLPQGWYGEIFRTTDGVDDSGPIVHFANSPLILGERSGYAGPARQTMRPGDAIVCVWNMPSLPHLVAMGGERVSPNRGWDLLDASDATFEGVGPDRSSLRKTILVGERLFDLVAFFGVHPAPFRLVREVEGILATVRIDAAPGPRGNRLEQYFSSSEAVRIHKEVRRQLYEIAEPHMTPEERAAHRAAFPDGV